MSKGLSIRKLPPELEKAIVREAKRSHKTKTDVVLEALNESLRLEKPSLARRDIRGFFGKMTAHDYKEFQKHTHEFSAVDEEMWK